jgi:hypothetical protein
MKLKGNSKRVKIFVSNALGVPHQTLKKPLFTNIFATKLKGSFEFAKTTVRSLGIKKRGVGVSYKLKKGPNKHYKD